MHIPFRPNPLRGSGRRNPSLFPVILAGTIVGALAGCDSDEPQDEPAALDFCEGLYETFEPIGDPSFVDDVMPLLQQNCNVGICHGGSPELAQAQLWLGPEQDEDPTEEQLRFVYDSLVNVQALAAPDLALVRPSEPLSSFLMLKLDDCHDHPALECTLDPAEFDTDCGQQMPPIAQLLNESERDTVRSWIALGARNN